MKRRAQAGYQTLTMPRRQTLQFLLVIVTLAATGCGEQGASTGDSASASPPVAERRPHAVLAPSGHRNDPYFWIRDDRRSDPDVLDLLQAENRYTAAVMTGLEPLVAELEQEMRDRIPERQQGAPFHDRGYWYYERYDPGKEHPILARRRDRLDGFEQVLLDGNRLADESAYFRIGAWDVSPDGNRFLWLQDVLGRRQFELRLRDLETGRAIDPGISGVSSAAWSSDGRHILYVENHPETLRAFRVKRLDPASGRVEVLYEETDTAFSATVGRARSNRYDLVQLRSWTTTELRTIDTETQGGPLELFLSRNDGHDYRADHVAGGWIIRTNLGAPNFRIVHARDAERGDPTAWNELVAHREDAFIEEVDPFDGFLAYAERVDGLRRLRVLDLESGDRIAVDVGPPDLDETVHVAQLGRNPDPTRRALQFVYTSPTTPQTTWELDLDTGQRRLLNRLEVGGAFEPSDYRVQRLWVEARDGARIPVSLSWHRDTPLDGTAPLLQSGYGAYGSSREPAFSNERLSLLDRGVVHAIAHVRGGQEMGHDWYQQGRLLSKRNSFTDFIDVTRDLVDRGMVDGERVLAEGASAGGLLVGAVANMAPDTYRGIVARVPFVDVVTTMLDASIPLTTFEYAEWGNPRVPEHYRYMLSYSPYDNVRKGTYPAMWVTAGLWDSQVQYWEPVKWVARLRHRKTDRNPLLLKVDMESGHGGRPGRYQRLEARAREYAFLLDQAGLAR